MNLREILYQIAMRKEIIERPPVLVDIGASLELKSEWKEIAFFSIGLAFDADARDFTYVESRKKAFKRLDVFNRLVLETDQKEGTFYLTRSPHCSSFLPPNSAALSELHYSELFEVVGKESVETMNLREALKQSGVDYIDWFKVDTQGTDVRLFKSLSSDVRRRILIAEFEPGFIDAYHGEDKILDLLKFMNGSEYFLSDFDVKGPLRMPAGAFEDVFPGKIMQMLATKVLKPVPGWAEICYMNRLSGEISSVRDFLLAWLFATLKGHHEIALVFATRGAAAFDDPLLREMIHCSRRKLKGAVFSITGLAVILMKAVRKIIATVKHIH